MRKVYYFVISQYGRISKEFRTKKSLDKFIRERQSVISIKAYKVKRRLTYQGMFYQTKTKINKIKF